MFSFQKQTKISRYFQQKQILKCNNLELQKQKHYKNQNTSVQTKNKLSRNHTFHNIKAQIHISNSTQYHAILVRTAMNTTIHRQQTNLINTFSKKNV